jgi:pyruvate/oxaloacetate carboxyltransferase
MACSTCRNLERAYETGISEYAEARASVCYRVSTVHAAQKNVDMERARYELEEHRSVCASAASVRRLLPDRDAPRISRQLVA